MCFSLHPAFRHHGGDGDGSHPQAGRHGIARARGSVTPADFRRTPMAHPLTRRLPCSVCGIDTFRHTGWFLVVENRWVDRLKILSWHPALATLKDMKSVCCRQHLKALIAHWLTQASLRLPPENNPPLRMGSDATLSDVDLGPNSVGRLVGELAVHRESFSRVW